MTDDLPLSEHVVLETSDLAEVNRHMRRELPTRRLAFATDRRRLAARLHAVAATLRDTDVRGVRR